MSIDYRYRTFVRRGVVAAVAAGPLGAIPGSGDALAIGGIWTTMFTAIARESGRALDSKYVAAFITCVASGAAAYIGGCKAATWLFHLIPGAGTLAAIGASTAMNAIFTYKFGSVVADSFGSGEFDSDDATRAARAVLNALCSVPSLSDIRETFAFAH